MLFLLTFCSFDYGIWTPKLYSENCMARLISNWLINQIWWYSFNDMQHMLHYVIWIKSSAKMAQTIFSAIGRKINDPKKQPELNAYKKNDLKSSQIVENEYHELAFLLKFKRLLIYLIWWHWCPLEVLFFYLFYGCDCITKSP